MVIRRSGPRLPATADKERLSRNTVCQKSAGLSVSLLWECIPPTGCTIAQNDHPGHAERRKAFAPGRKAISPTFGMTCPHLLCKQVCGIFTARIAHRASHLTSHASHLTPHISHLTPHASHLTPHASRLTSRLSHHSSALPVGFVRLEI